MAETETWTPDAETWTPDAAPPPPTQGGAVEAGLVSGTPLGRAAAAGAEAVESYLPKWARAPGDVPIEFDPSASLGERYRGSYESIGARTKAAEAAYPKTFTAASLAPAIVGPRVSSLGRGALTGAIYGGGTAANTADDLSTALSHGAVGAGFGALTGGAMGWGLGKLAPEAATTYTAKELHDLADQKYDHVWNNFSVPYNPSAVSKLGQDIGKGLSTGPSNRINAPQTWAHLDMLNQPPSGGPGYSLADLESVRRGLSGLSVKAQDPLERSAAAEAMSHIGDFMENPTARTVIGGPWGGGAVLQRAQDAGQLLRDARSDKTAA